MQSGLGCEGASWAHKRRLYSLHGGGHGGGCCLAACQATCFLAWMAFYAALQHPVTLKSGSWRGENRDGGVLGCWGAGGLPLVRPALVGTRPRSEWWGHPGCVAGPPRQRALGSPGSACWFGNGRAKRGVTGRARMVKALVLRWVCQQDHAGGVLRSVVQLQ